MTFLIERKTISRRENGTELVRAVISRPKGEYSLLQRLVERAEAWVDDELLPCAKQAFADDPDPSKRFSFRRFEYALSISLSVIREDVAELSVEATLVRARGERLSSAASTYYMRLSDGSLLPPKIVKRCL